MPSHKKKKYRVAQPVNRVLVTPEVTERKLVLNPSTNEYELCHVTTPAVYKQERAMGPTTTYGQKNTGGVKAGMKSKKG